MLLLSLFLVAFVTYFIWKPLLTLQSAAVQQQQSSQQIFEQFQQTFKQPHRATQQDQRPKQGFQGGEYIDFEEL
jgi:hypothetical protein